MKTNDSNFKGSPTISIVEDDASVRKSLERSFRLLGFTCKTYDSAESFLNSSETTDCLVSDIGLPGMNGLELQLAMRDQRPHVPVLLITASDDAMTETLARANGAAGFFRKPLDFAFLLESVHGMLFESK